jgi:hypothetical protein
VLLKVTGLGQGREEQVITELRKLLEFLKARDPKAITQADGFKLLDGLELTDEAKAELLTNPEEFITKLETALAGHKSEELAPGADESTWPNLRRALETAGLIRVEHLPLVKTPYIKFHPALAPALWEQALEAQKEQLLEKHRAAYYELSRELYTKMDEQISPCGQKP